MAGAPDSRSDDALRERFAAWLESVDDPDLAALDRLCADHPDGAERFRRWFRELAAIGELGGLSSTAPGTETIVATDAPLAGGDAVGPYRLVDELGHGAQARVWRATDVRDGREVALKLLPAPLASDVGHRLKRFRREARAEHPHICRIHEAGAGRGTFYLAMQLVPGDTLAAHIAVQRAAGVAGPLRLPGGSADGRDALPRLLAFFATVADALHAAHEVGLIHRDVKPGNLMVTPRGEPVVCDFGLARDDADVELLTRTGDLVGTPAYMSPEQIAAQRIPLDRRSDVFSLGATLYEALSLERPFVAPTMDRLLQSILSAEPRPLARRVPGLPADLAVVVATCLEKDRNRRYATAADLARDLRAVAARGSIRARPAGVVRRAGRWVRRNPIASAVLSVLTVATFAVGAVAWEAVRANRRFELVSTIPALDRAVDAAATLHPAWPATLPALEAWMDAHGRPLAARVATVDAALEALGDAPASDVDRGLRATLLGLRGRLDAFVNDPAAGGLADIGARIDWARTIAARSIDAHAAAWAAAREAVAADLRFEGFDLPPQLGLVPLGADPASGLQEFAHLRSGAVPARDPETGDLRYVADAGIVFVLVPPGVLPAGSPHAGETVPAFLIGKHEVTKAQWLALTDGTDAGVFVVGVEHEGELTTARHPAESLTHPACRAGLARHGLELPPDAWWEHAARGGRTDAGVPWEDLRAGRANLGGAEADDGYRLAAPVGGFAANGYGLFDVFGNVFEWCADAPMAADDPAAAGEDYRYIRGGSFKTTRTDGVPEPTRLWMQPFVRAKDRDNDLGLRAARRVLPASGGIRR